MPSAKTCDAITKRTNLQTTKKKNKKKERKIS